MFAVIIIVAATESIVKSLYNLMWTVVNRNSIPELNKHFSDHRITGTKVKFPATNSALHCVGEKSCRTRLQERVIGNCALS